MIQGFFLAIAALSGCLFFIMWAFQMPQQKKWERSYTVKK